MIEYIVRGHEYAYEVQTMIQVFYSNEKYVLSKEISGENITVLSELVGDTCCACVYEKGVFKAFDKIEISGYITLKELKRLIKTPVFNALNKVTGFLPPWGMITGVRPAKTANELMDLGRDDKFIFDYFNKDYKVSESRAKLSLDIAKKERGILSESAACDISLYIGIPFCPAKCLYCSFTSYPIKVYAKRIDDYLQALVKELVFLSKNISGYNIKSVYIGGGTPTTLTASQLNMLLGTVNRLFDLSSIEEYSVEAGRPDTIDEEKLEILKKHNVGRISINPQTMEDETLSLIGRGHSAADVVSKFNMARGLRLDINMDIILGLPGEDINNIRNTLDKIIELDPENITIHTLAVKRASRLRESFSDYTLSKGREVSEMLDLSYSYMNKNGFEPYYMYRQKNMLGNFENVGFCKKDKECIYNILIMEEKQTILAAGAGATTKLYDHYSNRIERAFNVKDVDGYINRIDEMIERKKEGFGKLSGK